MLGNKDDLLCFSGIKGELGDMGDQGNIGKTGPIGKKGKPHLPVLFSSSNVKHTEHPFDISERFFGIKMISLSLLLI